MTIPKKRVVPGGRPAPLKQRSVSRESERSTRRYATAVEFAMEGYAAVGPEGRLLKVNAAMCALTGYSRDEMLRLTIADLEAIESAAEIVAHTARIKASGNESFESRWKRRDGTVIDVAIAVTYVGRRDGEYFCFARDITGQKLALRSARNLSRVVEQSPSLIIITDAQGNIEYVNPTFTRVTGYTLAEVIGKNPRILRSSTVPLDEYAGLWKTINSGGTWRGEFCNRKKNGDLYWEDASISGVQGETGVLTNVVGVKLDITERKRAEDELKHRDESLQRFRVAMDSTADAIYVVDRASMRFIDVNAAACRLRGQTREEIFALGPHGLLSQSREELERAYDDLIARGGKSEQVEFQRQGKDGSQITLELERSAQRTGEGWMIVTVSRDITERKRVEAAILQSADALRGAFRRLAHAQEAERRKLAAELHDQVGQELSALHLNLIVIGKDLSGETNANLKARLDDSIAMTRQVSQQIRDVMGQLRPPMLDDYGLFATLRWLAHQTSQRSGITCVLDGEEPAERLPGEIESALLRISQEALTNAVKYSEATWISLALTTTPRQIRLEIIDDGAGFDLAQLAYGPQLTWGIRTMRERAQSLGGLLEIESGPGRGTRIVAEVPIA